MKSRTVTAPFTLTFRPTGWAGKFGGEEWLVSIGDRILGTINAFAPEVDPWQWAGHPMIEHEGLTDAVNEFVRAERASRRGEPAPGTAGAS